VRLVGLDDLTSREAPHDASWGLLALAAIPTPAGMVRLSEPVDADEYARVLYSSLREADALGLLTVLAVAPPSEGIGAAVLDRLTRAAATA
jgi:L-threonylcarbamoyladenylate synthase